ncbi:MAG: LETM1-related biofilm-associated protein [Flavobacterium sp.]|jgi:hypothetical protein
MLVNPSNIGWIEKLIKEVGFNESFNFENHHTFYQGVYQSGYLYGYTQSIDVFLKLDLSKLTQHEISKIFMFSCLVSIYKINNKNTNFDDFLHQINTFYSKLIPKNQFLHKILPTEKEVILLENYIENRVKINENFISVFFNKVFTNTFLFLDVLAFKNYLISDNFNKNYLSKFEENCINLVLIVLPFKSQKSKFDDIILKTINNSLKYNKLEFNNQTSLATFNFNIFEQSLEKYFILDLITFVLWQENENNELFKIIQSIGKKLELENNYVIKNIHFVNEFILQNQTKIPYFIDSNMFENLYSNSYSTVLRIISRNKNRIIKELSESKELLKLIALSSIRPLEHEEKKRMKKQLLDLCKVVPALTIFLLPGGGLLLPILVKFIPQLLPSSFNENID